MKLPEINWEGKDISIIGGGHSLKSFNFESIRGKCNIGINEAFRLGEEIAPIVFFGDFQWWNRRKWELEEKYKGILVTTAKLLEGVKFPRMFVVPSISYGMERGKIAWNFNSGAAALNLALELGAKRVFLLGFDLGASPEGETHWHDYYTNKPTEAHFERFKRGFEYVAIGARELFPDVEIYNVSNGQTKLEIFPIISFEDYLKKIGKEETREMGEVKEDDSSSEEM